jgi:signal transduction protein with GAF and PtsI domain
MDQGTARDFILDLQEENARLHQAVANLCNEMTVMESELGQWQKIAGRLFNPYTHMEGVEMYRKLANEN